MASMSDSQWRAWKTQLLPLLYDGFNHHNLTWPSQACRWGPKLEEQTYMTRYRAYLSEQTNPDEAQVEPPKLLLYDIEVTKPHVASAEAVSTWADVGRSAAMREVKAIVHPGEVNKIRELPQCPDVVVTHTDAPQLYVWHTASQPNMMRTKDGTWGVATPDMVLVGHEDDAQFPLATSSGAPMVASGGTDKLLLLWDLGDAAGDGGALTRKARGSSASGGASRSTTELQPRHTLAGHDATLEDVAFQPGSATHLVSVGDDAQVLFWDTRASSSPVAAVAAAHGQCDVHCCDWSGLQEHLVATGAADGSLKVWDRRQLPGSGSGGGAPPAALRLLTFHSEAIMRVEWSPTQPNILASGGDDHLLLLWDLARGGAPAGAGSSGGRRKSAAASAAEPPPEVLFKHVGHRSGRVVDFQWCPGEPWVMLSVSDDVKPSCSNNSTPQRTPAAASDRPSRQRGGGSGGGASNAAAAGGPRRRSSTAAAAAAGSEATEGDEEDSGKGGGTLQLWRIMDLLHRPEQDVVGELEEHRTWIMQGTGDPPQLRGTQAEAAAATAAAAREPAAAATPPRAA